MALNAAFLVLHDSDSLSFTLQTLSVKSRKVFRIFRLWEASCSVWRFWSWRTSEMKWTYLACQMGVITLFLVFNLKTIAVICTGARAVLNLKSGVQNNLDCKKGCVVPDGRFSSSLELHKHFQKCLLWFPAWFSHLGCCIVLPGALASNEQNSLVTEDGKSSQLQCWRFEYIFASELN